MRKNWSDFLDRISVGSSEAELATIETPLGILRFFIARRGNGRVAVLRCDSAGDYDYAPLNRTYLTDLIRVVADGREFLDGPEVPSGNWLKRAEDFIRLPFRGRVIRSFGRVRCESFVDLMVFITEWEETRYLAIHLRGQETSPIAVLDAAAIDTLLAALKKALDLLPPPPSPKTGL